MEKVVFTNGCFDIIHPGHIDLLTKARSLGTKLVVGINSDRSVRSIKGAGRPLQDQEARKAVLSALSMVDDVLIFDELTPERLIREIRPDVLVKGGDWNENEIVGADLVKASGGEVHSLPLTDGFSTSKIVNDLGSLTSAAQRSKVKDQRSKTAAVKDQRSKTAANAVNEHLSVFNELKHDLDAIEDCARSIFETFRAGSKVLICGNGGSAADSQHLAAEFAGRYESERRAFPAIALTTDTSALTAVANDYGFERVFARQVEALANDGDCLVAISTSGNSPNIVAAVMEARRKNCKIIGLTGAKGKKLASLCDQVVLVPSERTARIQEAHAAIAHIWCEMVDKWSLDL
jgi:D-sedoheptulose 7-phosphate isomerase